MLTIKNQTGLWFGFLAVLILLLVGCTPPGPRALLKGRELLEKGRYTEAVEQFETATSLLSSNAQAWNYLGLAYHHSRRSADAEKAYQHALRLDNDLTEARYNLGCLWLEENKLDWAKSELTAFTLRRGDNPQGFLKLATAQLRSQELTAAEKTFSEVLRIDPQDAEALTGIGLVRLQRGRAPEAAGYFVAALKHHPRYRPALINLAVVAHQHLRNKPLALQKYREHLALGPSNDSDQVKAAVRQLESETAPSAARPQPSPAPTQPTNPTIAKAPPQEIQRPAPAQKSQPAPEPPKTAALPTTHPAPTPQGTVSANKPKPSPPQTETTLTETVRLAPEPVIKAAEDADHSDASVHSPGNSQVTAPTETATQPAKAPRKSVFQRLFGRDNPARESNASQPAAEMPSQTVTGAIARYKYAAPPKPRSGNRAQAERAFAQGVQAHQANRLQEAMQAYQRAIQLDASYFDPYYNLGLAASQAGNTDAALAAYEAALTVRPESLDSRYNFALALQQANYHLDAARELEIVLKRYPNESRAHLASGNLYAQQLSDPAKARQHYLRVLATAPHHPQAGAIRYWLADHP